MGKIKYGLATLLAIGFWMGATSATVLELPAWERNYTGTIAGKPVNVNITRFGNTLYGYYCYEPCNQHKAAIVLRGSLQDKEVHLEERVKALSGYWNAEISSSEIKGEWTSADKKRHFPVALIYLKPKNSPDIVLVTNTNDAGGYDPSKEIDCGNTPAISAIKLYRDGKLIQTLDTASVGTCSPFMPQWGDVNFDGYPDLSIGATCRAECSRTNMAL